MDLVWWVYLSSGYSANSLMWICLPIHLCDFSFDGEQISCADLAMCAILTDQVYGSSLDRNIWCDTSLKVKISPYIM